VKEAAEDAAAYHKAMFGTIDDRFKYFGMSRFDFI
jgi:hypothetical protein